MTADLTAAGLARLLDLTRQIPGTVDRMREANEVADVLRQFEAEFCNLRDTAIRQDRELFPRRTVDQLVELTGIGFSTITNARRLARPVKHRGRYRRRADL